ncbi:MAG: TatD family hydrolase [Saprospiraceae bacterium]|nr:TatD family hydrolase [Saprospiraceae bacterium]
MILADTHTHLYLDAFDKDRKIVVEKAIKTGIELMFLPNIDSSTINPMHDLCKLFPKNCFPMMGLHPGSVKENYAEELQIAEKWLKKEKYYAIGEIGIDLYWDKTFVNEQEIVFREQLDWAKKFKLPVVIHCRDSFDEIITVLNDIDCSQLNGVFHCFTGSLEQAEIVMDFGFMLGIGGVVSFKNSGLDIVVKRVPLEKILLETDSPYLTPTPFRGKRNESSYIQLIAEKIAEIKKLPIENIAEVTTKNAIEFFGL